MNCPQCQTANAPGAGFCGNCGANLSVAEPAAAPAAGYGPQGTGTPAGYGAPTGYEAPAGYNAPGGYHDPATQQAPVGYPQGQYQAPVTGGYTPGTTGGGSLPPVKFDLSRATTVDKVVAVATFITMISIWMPWVTVSDSLGYSASASGTAEHGWLWLEFLLGLVLVAYLVARVAWDKLPFSLPVSHDLVLIIGTAVQLLLVLIAFIDLPSAGGITGISVGWGFGAFLGLLGALVAGGLVLYPAGRSYLANRNSR